MNDSNRAANEDSQFFSSCALILSLNCAWEEARIRCDSRLSHTLRMNFSRSGDDMVERGTHLGAVRDMMKLHFGPAPPKPASDFTNGLELCPEPRRANNILCHLYITHYFYQASMRKLTKLSSLFSSLKRMSAKIERLATNGAALCLAGQWVCEILQSFGRIALAFKQRLLLPLQLFFA